MRVRVDSGTRKNPFVSFGSIVSEARLQRVVVRSRWHAKQREEVEGVSRATNQPSESNMNRWERAQIENGRRGRDRPSRSDALHASIFIPLINSILVVHRSFIRTSVSLYLTAPRQSSLSRLSLSAAYARSFISSLSFPLPVYFPLVVSRLFPFYQLLSFSPSHTQPSCPFSFSVLVWPSSF